MVSPNNQIVPLSGGSLPGRLRSTWQRYKNANPVWHVVVPLGLGGTAGILLAWAWTMLDRSEYGAAMLLVLLFVIIGIGASLAVTRRLLRVAAIGLVVMVSLFSGAKIVQEKGDKPWTALFTPTEEAVRVVPQPPSPTPTAKPPSPSSAQFPFYSMFTARGEDDALLKMHALEFPYQATGDKNTIIILCRIDMPVHDRPTLSIYIPKTATTETAADAASYAVKHQQQIINKLLKELKADDRNAIALKARPVSVKRIHLYHEQPFNRSLVMRSRLPIHFFGPFFRV